MVMRMKELNKTFVLQHDASDCGVACLLSIIRYYGGSTTLQYLRELSGTTKQGTTLLGLYQAAGQVGFDAKGCETDILSLKEHGSPVILHLVLDGKFEHYMVCYGFKDGYFIMGDPAKGIITYTAEELEQVWKSHACLTLVCTNNFILQKDIKAQKRAWLIHLLRDDYAILGVSILVGLLMSVLGMTTAVFSQKLIDVIIPDKDYKRLWLGLVLVSFLLLARLGLGTIRQYMLFLQSRDFNNRLIAFFYNHLLRLPKFFFDTRRIGELVARLNDTRRIQSVVSIIAGSIVIDFLVTIVTLSMLFYYSWPIALLLVISIPLFIWIVSIYNAPLVEAQRNVMMSYAHSESNFINTMQGIDTIKNFNRQHEFGALNQAIYGFFQNKVFDLGRLNIKLSVVYGIISIVLIVGAIGIGSFFVLSGWLKLGELMAAISLVASIAPAIVNLALVSVSLNEAKVAFNRMFEFVGIPSEKKEGDFSPGRVDSIQVKNISFRFPGRKRILDNISLAAFKDKMIFIIGESGCGKSTFCKIMERAYELETGEILLNGKDDLRGTAIEKWRENIGVVPQDVFIFNGTVMDNLLLSGVDTSPQYIIDVCSRYGVDKYIARLPQGYHTVVGEEGINLSGGQKQLIAFARILVKNPSVLILDESTSAMDRDLEMFVMDLLSRLKRDKIILFISHRLHILKKYADYIYLIENGRVSHYGTHEEMMEGENMYADYWRAFM